MTADEVGALALKVGTLARDADLGGQLTNEEKDAFGFARTIVTLARSVAGDDPTAVAVGSVIGGVMATTEALMRLTVSWRKIDVKAQAMAISVSGLGDGVEVYALGSD